MPCGWIPTHSRRRKCLFGGSSESPNPCVPAEDLAVSMLSIIIRKLPAIQSNLTASTLSRPPSAWIMAVKHASLLCSTARKFGARDCEILPESGRIRRNSAGNRKICENSAGTAQSVRMAGKRKLCQTLAGNPQSNPIQNLTANFQMWQEYCHGPETAKPIAARIMQETATSAKSGPKLHDL